MSSKKLCSLARDRFFPSVVIVGSGFPRLFFRRVWGVYAVIVGLAGCFDCSSGSDPFEKLRFSQLFWKITCRLIVTRLNTILKIMVQNL